MYILYNPPCSEVTIQQLVCRFLMIIMREQNFYIFTLGLQVYTLLYNAAHALPVYIVHKKVIIT